MEEKGQRLTVTVNARFDGKDCPVKGAVKKAGKVVTSETATISADGKTLTGSYSGTDATGKQVEAVAVLERQTHQGGRNAWLEGNADESK